MKVKELINQLKQLDQQAEVVTQEYTGCLCTIQDLTHVIFHTKGSKICYWDDSTYTKSVSDNGICKTNVVYLR